MTAAGAGGGVAAALPEPAAFAKLKLGRTVDGLLSGVGADVEVLSPAAATGVGEEELLFEFAFDPLPLLHSPAGSIELIRGLMPTLGTLP
jgi:hypothetical protein